MAGKKTIQLFYDVISPYSWFAFEALTRYQSKWNVTLKLKPFFLGGVMHASGNQAPALVPNKAAYLSGDLQHLSSLFNVPLNMIKDFGNTILVKGSLPTQRFLTAIQMKMPEKTEELSRQLWLRIWSRDEDIIEEQSLRDAAKKAGITDAVIDDALQRMKTDEVKNKLREVTNEALDYKAFGAPVYVVNINGKNHTFFGCDRIEALAHVIGEKYEGPLGHLSKL